MKKVTKLFIFAIIAFIAFSTNVLAESADLNLCAEKGVQQTFMIVGYALIIIKIVVPILLMIYGCIDMFKAVIGADSDAVKKQTMVLAKRAIAAIVIFLIPTIVDFAFTALVNDSSTGFDTCEKCLFHPDSCPCR